MIQEESLHQMIGLGLGLGLLVTVSMLHVEATLCVPWSIYRASEGY